MKKRLLRQPLFECRIKNAELWSCLRKGFEILCEARTTILHFAFSILHYFSISAGTSIAIRL